MKRLEQINSIIDRLIAEATNHDLQSKLEILKPKRKFLARIRKQDISLEEYQTIIKKITYLIYREILKTYPFSLSQSDHNNYKLSSALKRFYNLHYAISFSKDKAKLYPISLDEKTAREIYKNELLTIIQEHITTKEDYDSLFNKKITLYQERIDFYKQTLKEIELQPYYGTPKFMYEHALYIMECANKLPTKQMDFTQMMQEMKAFIEQYPETSTTLMSECYPYFDKTYKSNFEKFEKNFLTILNYENSLIPTVASIWKSYLSDPKNHNNSSFKYIIHVFSENLVSPKEMRKACCSLATEQLLTTPYGNCGLIYDFTPEALETISTEDAKSWELTKTEFIENELPLKWQFTPSNIFYEDPEISKLILPTDLEKNGIANNLVFNQELLNYQTHCAYTEILLNSNAQAIGVFYTDECQNVEEIKQYAKKYNLPLIHLSQQQLRTQAGLNPIAVRIDINKEVSPQINR